MENNSNMKDFSRDLVQRVYCDLENCYFSYLYYTLLSFSDTWNSAKVLVPS